MERDRKLTLREVLVTPEMAQEWLDNRAKNRPIKQRIVQRYSTDMGSGKWDLNGETIKIDWNGKLTDGQHRLQALVHCGKPQRLLVVEGVPPKAFDTIDTGTCRTITDLFGRDGVKNANKVAGAVSYLFRHEKGKNIADIRVPLHQMVAVRIRKEHPEIVDSVAFVLHHKVNRVIPASLAGALHFLFSQKSKRDADFFFEHLGSGEDLKSNSRTTSGILALRNRMTRHLSDTERTYTRRRKGSDDPRREALPAMVIKAWNAMREQRVISRVSYGFNEEFPEIL